MFLEIIFGLLSIGAVSAMLQALIDWAKGVVRAVIGAIESFLYATRKVAGAVFQTYTRVGSKYSNQWVESTKAVNESQLPPELRKQQVGQQVQISKVR